MNAIMKKELREMQTLHAGYSKPDPKIFCHATDPLPRGTG